MNSQKAFSTAYLLLSYGIQAKLVQWAQAARNYINELKAV